MAKRRVKEFPDANRPFHHTKVFAIFAPALLGAMWIGIVCIWGYQRYGLSAFIGTPFIVGFLSAFLLNRFRDTTASDTYWVAQESLIVVGVALFFVAIEGAFCLALCLPIAVVLAFVGSIIGRVVGRAMLRPAGVSFAFVPILPGLLGLDLRDAPDPPLREVTTRVTIDAPIDDVWRAVVAFPPISEAPSGILRLGVAYPIGARIEGEGVGAIRHCEFSTGSFVEPITHWEPPHRLAFDVVESPVPLEEISIYDHLDAPHLHGFFVSRRGQFVLREVDGRVELEGTTWYFQRIEPQAYWGPISDAIIHAIHRRVLEHIERVVEAR